jgi:hypothetical protein
MITAADFEDIVLPIDPKRLEMLGKVVDLLNELDYCIAQLECDQATRQ